MLPPPVSVNPMLLGSDPSSTLIETLNVPVEFAEFASPSGYARLAAKMLHRWLKRGCGSRKRISGWAEREGKRQVNRNAIASAYHVHIRRSEGRKGSRGTEIERGINVSRSSPIQEFKRDLGGGLGAGRS